MRFALIDGAKAQFPVHRLCRVLGVSQSGYFAWRGRSACRRQRDDLVLLAHVRSAFALSNGTYGSPRMTRELQDAGLVVGRCRIARLMRDNGLQARQKRRFKRTTDSHHAWPVAPNLLDQDFTAPGPDKKWGADISYVWTREGWLYLPLFRTARGKTGALTGEPMHRIDAYRMIRRRAAEAGFKQKLGCHVFRATGITAYLEAGGTLENAQAMAAHESPRTTKLYDRTGDEITLDEVERIQI